MVSSCVPAAAYGVYPCFFSTVVEAPARRDFSVVEYLPLELDGQRAGREADAVGFLPATESEILKSVCHTTFALENSLRSSTAASVGLRRKSTKVLYRDCPLPWP